MISSFAALRFFNALLIFAHHKNAIENPYMVAIGPCAVSFFFMRYFLLLSGLYKIKSGRLYLHWYCLLLTL